MVNGSCERGSVDDIVGLRIGGGDDSGGGDCIL